MCYPQNGMADFLGHMHRVSDLYEWVPWGPLHCIKGPPLEELRAPQDGSRETIILSRCDRS